MQYTKTIQYHEASHRSPRRHDFSPSLHRRPEAGSNSHSAQRVAYTVRTCEVGRRTYCKTAYDRYGGHYRYT